MRALYCVSASPRTRRRRSGEHKMQFPPFERRGVRCASRSEEAEERKGSRGRLCQLRQTYKRGGNVGFGPPLWAYAKNTVVAEWRGGGGTGERARYKMKWGSRTETGEKKENLFQTQQEEEAEKRSLGFVGVYPLCSVCPPRRALPTPPPTAISIASLFPSLRLAFPTFLGVQKFLLPLLSFFFSPRPLIVSGASGRETKRRRRGRRRTCSALFCPPCRPPSEN